MPNTINAPIDWKLVNEHSTKIIAIIVFLMSLSFLGTLNLYIPAFLMFDFYVRAFCGGKYSLLQFGVDFLEKKGILAIKMVDNAPKRFAAQIGFLLTDIIFIALIIDLNQLAFLLGLLLAICSFAEGFLGICIICYIYASFNNIVPSSKSSS